MTKTLTITLATVVLVLAAAGSLLALGAAGRAHQTCGKADPADLRAAGAPDFAQRLERLARCER